MSKIPLRRDFNITPTTINAAGTALDIYGLLLSNHELLPVGKVSEFTTAAEVGLAFGTTSREYQAASLYLSGYDNATVRPQAVLFGRWVDKEVSGWLLSGSFKGMPITALQSIHGTLTLNIDGTTKTSEALDLASATSFTDAATAIATALGKEVTVEWLPIQSRFLLRSATTGTASQVTQAQGEVAKSLKLTADSAATSSAGATVTTMADTMDSIVNQNQDWVLTASLVDFDETQKKELAAWVSQSANRFGYVYYDESATATIANNPSTFQQSVVVANGYENVMAVFGSYLYAVLALAYSASLNFTRTNGRVSYKFRSFSGIAPNVSDNATASALESNGYNYYGAYSQNKTMKQYVSDGQITGKYHWLDSFLSQVWINANLIAAFANLFSDNASFAFNATGYAAVSAAVIEVASRAKNFGAIRAGVTLDPAQIKLVNGAVKSDVKSVLYTEGWYFYIPPQNSQARTERILQGAIFYYVDGQLIQRISLNSTDIL